MVDLTFQLHDLKRVSETRRVPASFLKKGKKKPEFRTCCILDKILVREFNLDKNISILIRRINYAGSTFKHLSGGLKSALFGHFDIFTECYNNISVLSILSQSMSIKCTLKLSATT